jgi:hypothetical protein
MVIGDSEVGYLSVLYTLTLIFQRAEQWKGPPIAMLHCDLLWQILAINTTFNLPEISEVFGTYSYHPPRSPLITIRHLSQGCAACASGGGN